MYVKFISVNGNVIKRECKSIKTITKKGEQMYVVIMENEKPLKLYTSVWRKVVE